MRESLFRPKMLRRERIDKLLEAIFETPLFYLSASMGYGKTTAIRYFLESHNEIHSIWLPTSKVDTDEAWAWKKFIELLRGYDEEAAEKCLGMGLPKSEYEIRRLLDLIEENIKEPTVIVIDNYHSMKCQSLLDRILEIYTEYKIPNVHVIVISRMRPTANFLLLNVKGRCMIMWQKELAFSIDETRELFELNGFKLQEHQIKELYKYTMGWVAPTYLMLLEYAAHGNMGIMSESTELIKATVYDRLEKSEQRILMMLAPIKSFTIELGEYITGDRGVSELLKEMLSNNCFVNFNSVSKEYEFHTIFKYSLLEELKKSDIDEKEIMGRCAQWYESRGEILNAISYYDKTRNDEAILEIMAKPGATEYFNVAPKFLIEVFEHIALEKKLACPMGYLTFILLYMIVDDNKEDAFKLLAEAKEYYIKHKEIKNWQHIIGEIYLIESYSMIHDYDKMSQCVQAAYNTLENHKSKIHGEDIVFTCGNIHISGLFHSQVGKYLTIRDVVIDGLTYFKQMTDGCTAGMKYLVRAEYAYDTGEIEKARLYANKSIFKAETKKQLTVTINAYFVLMRISLVEGRLDEIETYMSELDRLVKSVVNPIIHLQIEMVKGYIYGSSRQIEKIPERFKNFDMKKGMDQLPRVIVAPTNLGLALLCKKEYMQLEVFMEAFLEELKKDKLVYPMIHVYILCAIARLELYDEEEATDTLIQAIELAEPDGIVMPFVEAGSEIKGLLEMLSERSQFVKRILETYSCYENRGMYKEVSEDKIDELLTDREKDVMKLFTKGYKQSEIASELQITVDTVKRHIKNVYSKMDIHSKAELIEKLGHIL